MFRLPLPLPLPLLLSLAVLSSSIAGHASEALPGAEVPVIANGVNHVDLAGQSFLIVSAWRDNGNAHGFNVVTMYADLPGWSSKPMWQIVPVFLKKGGDVGDTKEALELITSGGADCTLKNFRLFSPKGSGRIMLVLATRDFGDSYYDTRPVTFDFYRLEKHPDNDAGQPKVDFTFDHSVISAKPYCDVDVALKKELALPAMEGTRLPGHSGGT